MITKKAALSGCLFFCATKRTGKGGISMRRLTRARTLLIGWVVVEVILECASNPGGHVTPTVPLEDADLGLDSPLTQSLRCDLVLLLSHGSAQLLLRPHELVVIVEHSFISPKKIEPRADGRGTQSRRTVSRGSECRGILGDCGAGNREKQSRQYRRPQKTFHSETHVSSFLQASARTIRSLTRDCRRHQGHLRRVA